MSDEANLFAILHANNLARKSRKMLCMKSLADQVREHRESLGMNPAEYARHVGTSRQNINNVEAGEAKQPRYIGKLAKAMGRTLDDLLGTHAVSVSRPPHAQPRGSDFTVLPTTTTSKQPVGSTIVGRLDIRASMGPGVDRAGSEEVVSQMVVDEVWLRRNCTFTSPENLSLVTGQGDSMRPTFEDGDALLVDRGVRECRVDGLYCLALNDELYIKRLQRRPDGSVMMISDNRAYEPYQISQGKDRVDVLGRVVMAWNARRM